MGRGAWWDWGVGASTGGVGGSVSEVVRSGGGKWRWGRISEAKNSLVRIRGWRRRKSASPKAMLLGFPSAGAVLQTCAALW